MSKLQSNLVFIDLETTGLEASNNVILEIAALPVDSRMNILDDGWSTVIYYPTKELLPQMADVVEQMHHENGLFAEIAAGGSSLKQAQLDFIRYAEQFVPHGQTPIAGSTVEFDRRFLHRYMPEVDKFYHYRYADVSSVKEYWKRWFPEAGEPPKIKAHRALEDCRLSVGEAKWYMDRLGIKEFQ
jgi:oligoribonuclease